MSDPEQPLPSNLVLLKCATTLPIPVERVLRAALDLGLARVMVVGVTEQDRLYVTASDGSAADLVLLLEHAKATLVQDTQPDTHYCDH